MRDRLTQSLVMVVIAAAFAMVLLAIIVEVLNPPPESGQVTAKDYRAAWMQPIVNCSGEPIRCTTTYIHHPERWMLRLRADNGKEGWRRVKQMAYDEYEVGMWYP